MSIPFVFVGISLAVDKFKKSMPVIAYAVRSMLFGVTYFIDYVEESK